MTDRLSEDEIVATITRLTRSRLVSFIDGELVRPKLGSGGYEFCRVDIARLELLCDLSIELDLDEAALGIVISLLDQLHAARQDLATLTQAINALPDDFRAKILASVQKA
jgi:chaperone modulatory protein CbpM